VALFEPKSVARSFRNSHPELQETLGPAHLKKKEPLQHRVCPTCKKGNLITLTTFTARGPPVQWLKKIKTHKK
jgi:hypothetical protein